MSQPLNVVIVGGGTAGWICAAALVNFADEKVCKVTLIESEEIGSVGVGEATLPHMKEFNDHIGINEADMMQKTNATFKLGIQFQNWGQIGNSYIHPFGKFGERYGGIDFNQHWTRANQHSPELPIGNFSYAIQACLQNRFEFPVSNQSYINSTYSYAYHFDASLYAQYLRKIAEPKNLSRVEGKILSVTNCNETGNIKSVLLENGQEIQGDFFIDCSGFRSLLLGQNLKADFEDWSQWLICDRAFAVPSQKTDVIPPFTKSIARDAGWQWRIPLQHRTGNGYVFCSNLKSEDEAATSLLKDLETPPLADPKLLKFKAGRYKKSWTKNCLAIGLSSGFLEPLESTSIYLIQVAVVNFIKLFPTKSFSSALQDEYNRLMDIEYERVRDFLILHYHLNQRQDSELWRYCQNMQIPESLKEKMKIFQKRGHIDVYHYGLFAPPSWIAVFMGQGLTQEGYNPLADTIPINQIITKLDHLNKLIQARVQKMPSHNDFLLDYCPSKL